MSLRGQTPGDVNTNFAMWLKADSSVLNGGTNAINGQSVETWNDLSGARTNDATDANETTGPTFKNNLSDNINYNPILEFNGTTDGLNFGNDFIFPDNPNLLGIELLGNNHFEGVNFFTVQKPLSTDASKDHQFVFDIGSYDADGFGYAYNYENSILYTPEGVEDIVVSIISNLVPIVGGLTQILSYTQIIGSNSSGNQSHSNTWSSNISRVSVVSGFDILGALLNTASKSISNNGKEIYSANNFEIIKLNLSSLLCSSTHNPGSGPFTIGRQSKQGDFNNNNIRAFEGRIGEIIGYTGKLTDSEKNKIESYLALKYAITLTYNGTLNGNYTASNGTTIWTADSIYQNNIIGIVRDDNSDLLQKQSHTESDDLRIYLDSLDTNNVANQGSFSSDISSVIIGHDNANVYSQNSFSEKPGGIYSRLDREWRIQTTNFSDTFSIDISLDSNAILNAIDPNDLYFLVDNDGDFSDANKYNTDDDIQFILNDSILTIANIHTSIIPNNSTNFFTVGSGTGNTPLPVSFKDFYLNENQESNMEISWETYTEKNNDYFTVYHSTDGVNWKTVQKIKSKGYSENLTFYSILDKTPEEGINFYKLEQTDLNGENTELAIDEIEVTNEINGLMAYPTPTIDKLHVKGDISISEKSVLINAGGIILPLPEITKVKDGHYILDLSHLSKGVYLLQTEKGTIRILKK